MKIGEIIKEYRTQKDLSIRDFAAKAGMSAGYISQIERGVTHSGRENESVPRLDALYKIASAMGISVNDLMEKMDEDSSVQIGKAARTIPVLGSVRAGIPLEACQNIIDYEEISPDMDGEYFALHIKGDSMTPRICEGDVVIVKKQYDVQSGDIAIVLVNGNEATCKKVLIGKDGITLLGFNPSFTPISYTKKDVQTLPVQIIGKVVELRAKL